MFSTILGILLALGIVYVAKRLILDRELADTSNLCDWLEEIEHEAEWRRQISELRATGDAEDAEWADYIEHGTVGPILRKIREDAGIYEPMCPDADWSPAA